MKICDNRDVGEISSEFEAPLSVGFLWGKTEDSNYGRLPFFYSSPNVIEVKMQKVGSFLLKKN